MPRQKPNSLYYTASQAKKVLNFTDTMLYNHVRKGNLQRIIPPGNKQGVYLKNEVDQLANELEAFFVTRRHNPSIFDTARKEDMKGIVELTKVLFGLRENLQTTIEKRQAWIEKNPDIFYVLKADGQVIGYAAILALKPEKIEKIFQEEEFAQDLTADDIEEFQPGKAVHLYFMAIGINTNMSRVERRIYGARLISGLKRTLVNLGRRGINIQTLYARSNTPDGIRLMRHMGLTEITSNTEKRNFVLEIERSGISEIVQYKEALKEYQSKVGQ